MDDMYPKRTWKNYLWNEEYLTCINQFGIGQSIMKMENGEQREILRDTDNRMIYIKEKDNAYCVNYNYNKLPFTEYYATVGMGYTKIVSEYNDIHSELLIFVAASGRRECWQLDITNKRNASRDIYLYGFAEVNSRISYHSSCNKDSFEKSVNGVCFQHIAYNSPTAYHCIHFASDANIYGYAHVIIGTSAENSVISRVSELALFSFFEKLGALLFIYKSK